MQNSPAEKQGALLLIDESLADRILAPALRLVDYNAVAVTQQFGPGVQDPILIQWLGFQGGIWITADEKAKRKHSEEIKGAGIHIVWVRRLKEVMSKKAQLLLLLWVIDPILEEIAKTRRPAQFLARYSGKRLKWERL